MRHWCRGGQTSIDNLVELCFFHHRLLHEGGYRVEGSPPHLRFLRPDGTELPERPPRAGPFDGNLAADNERAGVAITPGTIPSRWRGDRLDLGYVVSVYMQRPQRAEPT